MKTMTVRGHEFPRRSVVGAALALAILLAAILVSAPHPWLASYLSTGGFALLAASVAGVRARAAAGIAIAFAVYGGISATVALSDADRAIDQFDPGLPMLHSLGVVTTYLHPPAPGSDSFRYALLVTILGGVVAVLVAAAAALSDNGSRPKPRTVDAGLAERAGRILVLIGFAGFGLAALRFLTTSHAGQTA